MGKNVNGGNKNKKFARKESTHSYSGKLRLAIDEAEKYAVVIRISGGSICRVKLIGSVNEIICFIRGKHRGRNKTNNLITPGTIILVGLRVDLSSKEECDLLYVYDSNEVQQLLNFPDLNIALLTNNSDITTNNDDGFVFSNEVLCEMPFDTVQDTVCDTITNTIISIDDI
jgi:hypothetical protein